MDAPENSSILRLSFIASLVNPKCSKCLRIEKRWRTNPFMLDNLFVFLHQCSIVLTICLNFSGSLVGRTSGASVAKVSKFSSKYLTHCFSKLVSSTLSCSMGLSLILMLVFLLTRISWIASEISFAWGLWVNIWYQSILSMWITGSKTINNRLASNRTEGE